MKNLSNLSRAALVAVVVMLFTSCGASKQAVQSYSRYDELNEKLFELEQQGWVIDGSTRTLKGALSSHYDKIDSNDNLYEAVGNSTGCRSITVCRASALNAASVDFAVKMGQDLRGKTMRDMGLDESAEVSNEYNRFQEACISNFAQSIKGDLQESFALKQTNPSSGLNNYQIYFIVDKNAINTRRTDAIKSALEESKLNQEYARAVEKFIDGEIDGL
ncbi:MAG: hypothetical protein SNH27_15775 [Rikenellaceae bacterium]